MTDNGSASSGNKASFLDSLAAKIAGGPPKKPVGLRGQTDAEAAREQAARDALENSEQAQKRLGGVMAAAAAAAATATKTPDTAAAAEDKTESKVADSQ